MIWDGDTSKRTGRNDHAYRKLTVLKYETRGFAETMKRWNVLIYFLCLVTMLYVYIF